MPARPRVIVDTHWSTPNPPGLDLSGLPPVFAKATLQASRITFQIAGASTFSIEYACQVVGVDRVLYGSDLPFFEPADEIEKVRRADLPESVKEAIFSTNARTLLGIG